MGSDGSCIDVHVYFACVQHYGRASVDVNCQRPPHYGGTRELVNIVGISVSLRVWAFDTGRSALLKTLNYGADLYTKGPLSEVYGRVPVIQLSNLFFLAFNIGCGFAQTKGQMIAFRFFAGLGGSAPLSTGGGVLSDVWTADQRYGVFRANIY